MKIHLGRAIAHCAQCQGTCFAHADEREFLKEWPALVCAACGAPTTYAALLLQIGAEALAAARKRIDAVPLL